MAGRKPESAPGPVGSQMVGGAHLDPVPEDDDGRWTPRLIVALILIVALGEMAALSYNLVATALPGIGAEFGEANLGWVMTMPGLVSAIAIGFVGKLADLKGKKLLLIIVCLLAAIGAVISALAVNYTMFLVGRGLQGMMFVSPVLGYSLIRDVFPRRLIAFATTVTFSGFGAAFVIAPFIAGWLVTQFNALAIFWFIAVYLLVCSIGVLVAVPESPLRVKSRLNWQSAALLGIGGAAIVYGLGNANTWGWLSPVFVLVILFGIAAMASWIMWDRRHPEPLMDTRLLASRPVWTTVLAGGAVYASAGVISSLLPTMLQTPRDIGGDVGFGVDAYGVAVYLIPLGGSMVVAGLLCGAMATAWGVKRPVQLGCVLLMLGALGLAFFHGETLTVVLSLILFGLGMGSTYGGLPNLVIQAVPPEKQGISASIANVGQNLGTAVLLQIVFAILAGHALVTSLGSFFDSDGLRIAFLIGAGCAAVGLAICMIIPHGTKETTLNVKTGGDVAAAQK